MNIRGIARGRLLVMAALLTLVVQGRAFATPLGLTAGTPDIMASPLSLAFNSAGGVCGADTGYTLCLSGNPTFIYTYPPVAEIPDGEANYSLIAAIDPPTGTLGALGGSFAIGSYLTGSVSDFGYAIADGVAILEFIINTTGGTAASTFGSTVGVIGTVWGWGAADFGATPFVVNDPTAYTDNFGMDAPIPEPATLCLLGLGLFAITLRRRRHAR